MRYEAALDGVRAIAILAVLAYHCFPESLPGGFTGVDVFFVLSGYLIASVILYDLRDGSFSMREFYLRRAQRLLPNAVATVLVTVALSLVLLVPSAAAKTARHGVWTLFNLSNVYIWSSLGGYWSDASELAPLLHTWSLAVEEQFYLIFPATLVILSRLLAPRMVTVLALLTAGSFLLAVYGTLHHPAATFYFLPTRAWQPLLGAVLAALRVSPSSHEPIRSFEKLRGATVAGWLGLAAMIVGFFLVSGKRPYPGLVALVPTLGAAALIVAVAEGKGALSRFLSLPYITLVGRMSYSIYLWHWPGIVLGRHFAVVEGYPRRPCELAGAAVGVALSAIAYRYIEQPLRKRGPARKSRLFILTAGFSTCAAASVVLSLRPAPVDPRNLFDPPVSTLSRFNVMREGGAGLPRPKTANATAQPVLRASEEIWRTGGIIHPWGDSTPRVVVLGSSHALMFGPAIDAACRDLGISVAFLSASAVPAAFRTNETRSVGSGSVDDAFDDARRRWLREWNPDLVLVIDRWDTPLSVDFERSLAEFVDELGHLASRVVLFSQVPALHIGENVSAREFASWRFVARGMMPKILPDHREGLRKQTIRVMEDLARERRWLRVLRADEVFYQPDGNVRYSEGRRVFYMDDDHLSDAGADLVKDRIAAEIAAACGMQTNPESMRSTSTPVDPEPVEVSIRPFNRESPHPANRRP